MRRTVAAVLGFAMAGCTAVVDVGGFHARDGQVAQIDAGTDASMVDAFVPDAFVPPVDGGPCDGACGAGETCCGDTCVTLDTVDHCGACDNACGPVVEGTPICTGTECVFNCNAGFEDCNTDPVDGCEVALNTATDCGGCGNECAPTELCEAGAGGTFSCVNGCSAGMTPCGTSCVDTDTSMMHCGACDALCAAPTGATAACVAGDCQLTCQAGLDDCNSDIDTTGGDGCEVTLATDADHCGGCGDSCTTAGATTECVTSMCRIASCTGLRGDCDRVYATGCEMALDTRENCGGCGVMCGLDQECRGGSCQPCTPTVARLGAGPPPPAGMNRSCFVGPDNFTSAPCPVVQCGQLTTWAFSYSDNRDSFGIVTYDPANAIVRAVERGGARYLWDITLDSGAQTATFHGQGSRTVTRPWSEMRLP